MRMDEMNKDLENRGFTVTRKFVGGTHSNTYMFTIKRDGHELNKFFEYPNILEPTMKQKEFLRDFVAEFERMYPKYISYKDYCKHDTDTLKNTYKTLVNKLYGLPEHQQYEPMKVIFNKPATIVYWLDGSKTVVKAQNDEPFDPEKGLAMAIAKKALGNEGNYFNHIKKWTEDVEEPYSYDENDVTPQVEKAYTLLTNILHKSKATKAQMTTAIEEAIGYLGEVLGEESETDSIWSNDIIFDTRANAETFIDHLDEILDRYGFVSIADVYDELVGISPLFKYNSYGWLNINSVGVVRCKDGYKIKFPRPYPVEQKED